VPNAARPYGPRPLKELGQHFLIDDEIASRIVSSMSLRWEERTVEIGPGRGILLRFLLKKSHHVTAIELDKRLEKPLVKTFGGHPGLELIFDDFLQFNLLQLLQGSDKTVRLVGNIPYSLSAPILLHIFNVAETLQQAGNVPLLTASLMLQKEVAERVCAEPGGRSYGGITILRALVADAELLFDVPQHAFHPPPKVTSSIIKMSLYREPKYSINNPHLFKQLVQHVFKQRRKMLKNSLVGLGWLKSGWHDIEFQLTRRPEELSLEEFIRLYDELTK
jgi:16S rRNA (adenine1518-N6/adenine1519-N6)-dimethyltransferase